MTVAEILNKVENINLKFQVVKDKLPAEDAMHVEKSVKAFSLMKQMVELMDFDINMEIPIDALPPDAQRMMVEVENQIDYMDKAAQALVNEYFPAGS